MNARSCSLSLLALLAACDGPEPTPTPKVPTKVPTEVPTPTASTATCTADMSWITSPNPPAEVAADESFCDFYQFSWQWFLAQVSPSSDGSGERVWETSNRAYAPGQKDQCATATSGRARAAALLAMRTGKDADFEDIQADGEPLYDQAGNIVYYSMWFAPQNCNATLSGYTAGTLEIKTSWRVLPAADPTYLTMQTTIGGQAVTMGLVGFHLVNWTPNHPEMIWATFEHSANAPDCSGSSATPPGGWSFASAAAADCLAQNKGPDGQIPAACTSFGFNTGIDLKGQEPSPTGTPSEVCRLFSDGTDPGTSVNGNDNAANRQAIDDLNTALVGPQGLLTGLPDTDPMAVWKNYRMTGGIWTKGGAASGPSPVPHTSGGTVQPGDPSSLQRGSLELTNMTLETFEQGQTSPIPNCFGCHNYTPASATTSPLTVSHLACNLYSSEMTSQIIGCTPGTP